MSWKANLLSLLVIIISGLTWSLLSLFIVYYYFLPILLFLIITVYRYYWADLVQDQHAADPTGLLQRGHVCCSFVGQEEGTQQLIPSRAMWYRDAPTYQACTSPIAPS